jgi:FixJ family two-component response regulator
MDLPETKGTVLVVDDDPSVRKGLARLLRSSGFAVQTFGSAQEYLDLRPGCTSPACLVLDVMLPGLDGLGLQEELESQDNRIPIVFITGHGGVSDSVKAMKRGAVDFLSKPFDDEDLLRAVYEAMGQDSERRAARDEAKNIAERVERLTPREYEVLRHVIAGRLNKQIGFALSIAEKTVKVHRGRMMEKMEVASVAELVRLAEKVGIEPARISS